MNAKATKPNADQGEHAATPTVKDESHSATFWLLKESKCKKLGKHAEGGIKYQLLACEDRTALHVRITENEGGGYYSKEIVPFDQVELCLDNCDPEKPFPSKALKDAFTGRSSNNAGFLAAILREEGLLDAAKEPESQHMLSADISAWKRSALSQQGTKVEISKPNPICQPAPAKKTLTLPGKS